MSFNRLLDAVSARAPLLIFAALIAAVAGAKLRWPPEPFYVLAIALIPLALALWARRGLARQLKSKEQLGFRRNRDLLRWQFFETGTPRGYWLLSFLAWFGVVLTGLRFPYAGVAIAAMLLTVAWGEDRRRYPSEPSEH